MDTFIGKFVIIDFIVYEIVESKLNPRKYVSFFNRKSKKFLRHSNSLLIEGEDDGKLFKYDSSFLPIKEDSSVTFFAVNEHLENYAISAQSKYCISDSEPKCCFKLFDTAHEAESNILKNELKRLYEIINVSVCVCVCVSQNFI